METYKDYIIEPETDPWALKYKLMYNFYKEGGKIRSAESIQDAKDQIDEIQDINN